MLSRRAFGHVTAATAALPATAAAATAAPALDLSTPRANLHAYMKLHTSIAKKRVWYWYTGVFEATVGGGPVLPVFAIDTLIRRDVTPQPDGSFAVEMFEANYFHTLDDPAPARTLFNPLNQRTVTPFHYREGPHDAVYSERGIYGRGMAPPPGPFAPRWHRAGDQIWTANIFYINAPSPFPLSTWPLEGNVRERVGSFANLFGSVSELADPATTTARCTFVYEALMEWWPWMLMGPAPGQMLWHAGGRKLDSLEDLPAAARAGFEAIHPRIFAKDRPWESYSMMPIDYKKQRKPVLR
jgi:hypothetical protein